MILVVGNTKGGVGKSTLAVNIAIARVLAGRKVALVDGDQQQSSVFFTAMREKSTQQKDYTIKRLEGEEIYYEMPTLVEQHDDVIIDVGGWDSESLRMSLIVADAVLMPVIPQNFATWAFPDMVNLVNTTNKKRRDHGIKNIRFYVVLNKAQSSKGRDNEVTASEISGDGIELIPTVIVDRAVFNNAAAVGRSIFEHKPKNKLAIAEFSELMHYIYR